MHIPEGVTCASWQSHLCFLAVSLVLPDDAINIFWQYLMLLVRTNSCMPYLTIRKKGIEELCPYGWYCGLLFCVVFALILAWQAAVLLAEVLREEFGVVEAHLIRHL